jgi:hypothetical protein
LKETTEDLKKEILLVRTALKSLLAWQTQEKIYLTISSVLGTVVWGFGDVAAGLLRAVVPH